MLTVPLSRPTWAKHYCPCYIVNNRFCRLFSACILTVGWNLKSYIRREMFFTYHLPMTNPLMTKMLLRRWQLTLGRYTTTSWHSIVSTLLRSPKWLFPFVFVRIELVLEADYHTRNLAIHWLRFTVRFKRLPTARAEVVAKQMLLHWPHTCDKQRIKIATHKWNNVFSVLPHITVRNYGAHQELV